MEDTSYDKGRQVFKTPFFTLESSNRPDPFDGRFRLTALPDEESTAHRVHQEAARVMVIPYIAGYLRARGWPRPVLACCQGPVALVWRKDVPHSEVRPLVEMLLREFGGSAFVNEFPTTDQSSMENHKPPTASGADGVECNTEAPDNDSDRASDS